MEKLKSKKQNKKIWLAAIGPLNGSAVGFDWGTDRVHYLWGSRSEAKDDCCERIWDAATGEKPVNNWDVAWVDPEDGVTDDWPSAGDSTCWYEDEFLGVADYLSYRYFSQLLAVKGVTSKKYIFPNWGEFFSEQLERIQRYLPLEEQTKIEKWIYRI